MSLPSEFSNQNFVSLFVSPCVLHAPPISPSVKISGEEHESLSPSLGDVAGSQSDAEGASRLGCDAVRQIADVSEYHSGSDTKRLRPFETSEFCLSVTPLSTLTADTLRLSSHFAETDATVGLRTCRLSKFLRQASASSRQSAHFAQLCVTKHSHVRHCTLHCFPSQPTATLFLTPEYREVRKCAKYRT
jgi:hypothetical protein